MFYLLSSISIVQSILIDTHVLRYNYDGSPHLHRNRAISRINSIYNALIATFGWATGPFAFEEYWVSDHNNLTGTVQEAKKLVRLDKWQEWNIKSTKDFLFRLGSGVLLDGTYSGFVVQKQGLHENIVAKWASDPIDDGAGLSLTEATLLGSISEEASTTPEPPSTTLTFSRHVGSSSNAVKSVQLQSSSPHSRSASQIQVQWPLLDEILDEGLKDLSTEGVSRALKDNGEDVTKDLPPSQMSNYSRLKSAALTDYIPASHATHEIAISKEKLSFCSHSGHPKEQRRFHHVMCVVLFTS